MSSYWAAVGAVLVPLGALLKYLVWDFFHKVQSLDDQYSARIAESHAAIHERKFLPIIANIYETVAERKKILQTASTIDILTELSIDARFREAIGVISERIALDRSYRRARILSICVALPWLFSTLFFVVFFFRHYDAQAGIKSLWIPSLLLPIFVSGGTGCFTFALYEWALYRFTHLLGANPL